MFRVTTDPRMMRAGLLLTGLLVLAGCGGGGGIADSSGGSFTDRMSSSLFGPPATAPAPAATAAELDCPGVAVRAGGSTLAINEARAEPSPMNLRYQASIGLLARECIGRGNAMTIKVGVEGRIIVGPAGGPGQMEVPLRYTVVKEGATPTTITSKFHRVGVSIPAGVGNVAFSHIDDDISFPVPPGEELWSYVVYVGFDPEGLKQKPVAAKKQQRAPRKQ
jgi:hypothetical protein